jgi:hypothetical protein
MQVNETYKLLGTVALWKTKSVLDLNYHATKTYREWQYCSIMSTVNTRDTDHSPLRNVILIRFQLDCQHPLLRVFSTGSRHAATVSKNISTVM